MVGSISGRGSRSWRICRGWRDGGESGGDGKDVSMIEGVTIRKE